MPLQCTDAHWQQVDPTSFAVRTDDLSHVQHDVPHPTVQIKAARQGGACVATAFLTLGPSNGHATIKLASVYTKTEAMTMRKKMEAMEDPDAIRIYSVTGLFSGKTTHQALMGILSLAWHPPPLWHILALSLFVRYTCKTPLSFC
jgi:hypothetical protein